MQKATTWRRMLLLSALVLGLSSTAFAQRTVTLRLNTATLPDTTHTDSIFKVMGAVGDQAPFTLPDGKVISWNTSGDGESTIEPTNIGGDYWEVSFQVPNDQKTTFKFWSAQAEATAGLNGWEADPNPSLEAGTADTTFTLHYFESQDEWQGVSGDRGDYDWRFMEEKQDSIGVWFRVYMSTDKAITAGYDPITSTHVGVRGGPPAGGGVDDWSSDIAVLTRETSDNAKPGYHLFSGAAYFPKSAAGSEYNYKFIAGNSGWEGRDNRKFVIPDSDTTLHWVYFDDGTPVSAAVTSNVVFTVDLTPLQDIGVFDLARGDELQVRGGFNGWDCGEQDDDCRLFKVPGEPQFENSFTVKSVADSEIAYKFYLKLDVDTFKEQFGVDVIPSGWEEPISTTGADRRFTFSGDETQLLDIERFNDILPGNIMPDGASTDVTFTVDMNPAMDAELDDPFDPAADSVTVTIQDPFWTVTQGYRLTPRDDDANLGDNIDLDSFADEFILTDDDNDGIYTGTLTVTGPTYSGIQYKYTYGGKGEWTDEPGASASTVGRRRTRFIMPNNDGSWPASFSIVPETFQPEDGPLPFDSNPAATGIEIDDLTLPTAYTLEANYPNPFSDGTTFTYSITHTEQVALRVYDVTGREVATLVDGMQPAATYRVTFDGAGLASGVYIYRLETPTSTLTRKMMIVK